MMTPIVRAALITLMAEGSSDAAMTSTR